ncbi:LOW QUALITY PROTEIN: sulfhydryl oxidase 2 [Anomaloglossus baeobatrachus]|uniref:LOW QUALITY PROTEIN: sulfhydryl oxidase 2 n=1 Tax=Anomaloglossus baeobatrachus TaxID=238106 RepID=UPI003F4F5AB9
MAGCSGMPGVRAALQLLLAGAVLVAAAEKTLYGPQDAGIAILERRSITGALYNASSAWLLEYYSSWCGHCINYAPTWRDLGADVQDWSPAIRIGVLNCADEENTAICKDYGVQFYPTFRFFSPFTKDFTQGENYKAEADREVQTVRHVIIDYLESLPAEHRPPACPPLQPISSGDIASLLTQKDPRYTAIIFESEASYVGREVILDLMQFEQIAVRRAVDTDKAALEKLGVVAVPACYLIYPNASHGLINIVKPLRSVFSSHLKSLPGVRKKAGARSSLPETLPQEDEEGGGAWKEYDKSTLYTADLESALHYLLRVELATHQTLEGEKLKTFKDLITLLYKLFPGRPHVVKLLETLQEWLVSMPLDKIPYDAILDLVNNKMRISGIYLTNHVAWVGCQGSRAQLRGYPCSLWKLFHSLTVQAAVQPDALANTEFEGDAQAVLKTMRRYIRDFFGCRECAQHFEAMAKESVDGVKTADEAVLWLWRKHNVVNKRLAGAPSEDPKSPKVEWPTPALCPACHEEINGLHSWNEKEILAFLKGHYGANQISLKYSDPDSDRHEEEEGKNDNHHTKDPGGGSDPKHKKPQDRPIIGPDFINKIVQKPIDNGKNSEGAKTVTFLGLGFSNIDMSLCVVLYVTSSLFLMIMYFFFRVRSRKWKIRYNRPYV